MTHDASFERVRRVLVCMMASVLDNKAELWVSRTGTFRGSFLLVCLQDLLVSTHSNRLLLFASSFLLVSLPLVPRLALNRECLASCLLACVCSFILFLLTPFTVGKEVAPLVAPRFDVRRQEPRLASVPLYAKKAYVTVS